MPFIRSFLLLIVLCYGPSNVQAASWVDSNTHDGIVYFLYGSPALLKRYDLANEEFLTDIAFATPDTATAFTVDSDGIFVGFGQRLSRFNLDGSSESSLANTSSDIDAVVTSEFNVYAQFSRYLVSIGKSNSQINGSVEYFYSMKGLSYSRANDRLYARNSGVSPSDILYIELPDDGSLPPQYGGQVDSPYHGDYPNADKTFLFPDESRVVDSSGTVYASSNLSYIGSLGGGFRDLSFYVDLPIVLRNGELVSYSNTLLETGSFSYDGSIDVQQIDIFGENVFGFYDSVANSELAVVKTAIGLLDPAEPGAPINPVGLAYTPDKIIVGEDGIAYILSKSNLSIFRWSIVQQQYLSSIPLLNVPNFMAYSAENQSLYVAYEAGQINQVSLDGLFKETAFANLPQKSLGLSTAGEFIFAVDPSGAWVSHFVFDKNGNLLSQREWNYEGEDFVWNSVNRRMYHFRDATSPNDLHWEEIDRNGIIGQVGDSPYHSSTGIKYPISVSPDGGAVVLGSGRIYDGITLSQVNNLSNDIDDAVWYNDKLYTLRESATQSSFQEWTPSSNYTLDREQTVTGAPLKLLQVVLDNKHWLTLVSDIDGVPIFRPIIMGDKFDTDEDAIENLFDNCVYSINYNQADQDSDGIGDACEADFDNDNVHNDTDNCPTVPNSEQLNLDDDSFGDACDEDVDGDSVTNAADNCPLIVNLDQFDIDLDRIGDACDDRDDRDSEICFPIKTSSSTVLICL